jgi:hypothetical protein
MEKAWNIIKDHQSTWWSPSVCDAEFEAPELG